MLLFNISPVAHFILIRNFNDMIKMCKIEFTIEFTLSGLPCTGTSPSSASPSHTPFSTTRIRFRHPLVTLSEVHPHSLPPPDPPHHQPPMEKLGVEPLRDVSTFELKTRRNKTRLHPNVRSSFVWQSFVLFSEKLFDAFVAIRK